MVEKLKIKTCADCNAWQPLSDKHLEIRGFCYKISYLPAPKKRDDYCGDWVEYDGGVLG